MLSQYEYNTLPIMKKIDFLRQNGTFLLSREMPHFLVKLYSLGDFFVEAYFSKATYFQDKYDFQDVLTFRKQDLACIQRPHPLEAYLDQIDLRKLILG